MDKIRLRLWNENQQPTIIKSFVGQWLVGNDDEGLRADDDTQGVHWDAGAEWSVAETESGKLVVYLTHCNDGFAPTMHIYENFDEMASDQGEHGGTRMPRNVLATTAAALNIDFEEELDI